LTQPGKEFEEKVADWARSGGLKSILGTDLDDWKVDLVDMNVLVNGVSVKRPYEVDVCVTMTGPLNIVLQKPIASVWIECKDRRSSIKRADIAKLDASASDVIEANRAGRERQEFNSWVIVSTSPFDSDAVRFATQRNINCVWFDAAGFKPINKVGQ